MGDLFVEEVNLEKIEIEKLIDIDMDITNGDQENGIDSDTDATVSDINEGQNGLISEIEDDIDMKIIQLPVQNNDQKQEIDEEMEVVQCFLDDVINQVEEQLYHQELDRAIKPVAAISPAITLAPIIPGPKMVNVLDLECHFKWRKEISDETNELIQRRIINAVQGLKHLKNRKELESEMFPSKYISLKCIQAMFVAYRGDEDKKYFQIALENINFMKENLSAIFDANYNGYGYDLNGIYYLLDSMHFYIGYLQGNKEKYQQMFRVYDELSPRAKAFVLCTKLEYFKFTYRSSEVIRQLAKQIVALDPEFREWRIVYCKALRKRRLDGPQGRVKEVPSKKELKCLKVALTYNKDGDDCNCMALLTLCDLLCDFLRAGCVNHQIKIATMIFNGKDEIIKRVTEMLFFFHDKYPKSVRVRLQIIDFFRLSQLRSNQRHVDFAEQVLEEVMNIFPRHPKVFKEKALRLIKSPKSIDREKGLEFFENAMELEPLNSSAVLSYLKFLVGFGGTNLVNISTFNEKLRLAESEGWSLNFKITVMFMRGCLCWIEDDKYSAIEQWIYGYNYALKVQLALAKENDETEVEDTNPFLEKFWYLTRTQVKKNGWPLGIIGWKEILEYVSKPLTNLNEGELRVVLEFKKELEAIKDENARQRQLQNCPDPPNFDKYKNLDISKLMEFDYISIYEDCKNDDAKTFWDKMDKNPLCAFMKYHK